MTEVVRKMKQFRFKKVASILLAIAMVFTTLTVVSTTESQAATKAIKIKNVTGTTKSLNVGKTFTIKTNYTASKLTHCLLVLYYHFSPLLVKPSTD